MNTMKLLKSTLQFFAYSFWRNICLSIILGLVFTSSTQPELKPLPDDYGSQSHLGHNVGIDHLAKQLNKPVSNSYMWLICGFNSWEDLKIFLPEAKMAGISVGAILIPPYQSPQVNPNCPYSEPFGKHYIHWANEIANLSLRYSNLIGFGINNFQENIDLGYLTQTYIDSMVTTGKSINPLLQFIDTDTLPGIYYVDRDATGTGDGLSWVNASKTVVDLPWGSINGGDTVYVSGGADSTTYSPVYLYGKSFVDYVVITRGKDAGHDGEVYFQNSGTAVSYTFKLGSCRYIKVTGFTLTNTSTTDDSLTVNSVFRSENGNYNIVDNCNIISSGTSTCVRSEGDTNLTISNDTLIVLSNNYSSEADNIHISDGGGGQTIIGNYMTNGKIISSYSHPDLIQFSNEGATGRPLITIANNFMLAPDQTSTLMAGINAGEPKSNSYLIYNNIIVLRTLGNSGIVLYNYTPVYHSSAKIFNNTILLKGFGQPIRLGDLDTLIMKNNIVIIDTPDSNPNLWFADDAGFDIVYKDIDYNAYYKSGGAIIDTGYSGGSPAGPLSLSQWQTLEYDANSDTNAVSFANIWGTDIVDYLTTAGRDLGVDLSAYFITDIRAVIRPQNSVWDMGALESE